MELGALKPVLVHLRRLAVLFFAPFILTSLFHEATSIASLHRLLGFALRALLLLFGVLDFLRILLHLGLELDELLRRLLHCTVEPGAFYLVARRLWLILLRYAGGDGGELGCRILVLHLGELLLLWAQLLHRAVEIRLRSRFAEGGNGRSGLQICRRWNELATLTRALQHQVVVLHELDDGFRASGHQVGVRLPGIFTVIET